MQENILGMEIIVQPTTLVIMHGSKSLQQG